MRDDRFTSRVARVRDEALTVGLSAIIDRMARAGRVVGDLMDESADDRVRLAAAKTVLDNVLKCYDVIALSERVKELERRAGMADLQQPRTPRPPDRELTVEDAE
jgi:tetrahydromethanopterin S-methyltransferase subunit B